MDYTMPQVYHWITRPFFYYEKEKGMWSQWAHQVQIVVWFGDFCLLGFHFCSQISQLCSHNLTFFFEKETVLCTSLFFFLGFSFRRKEITWDPKKKKKKKKKSLFSKNNKCHLCNLVSVNLVIEFFIWTINPHMRFVTNQTFCFL